MLSTVNNRHNIEDAILFARVGFQIVANLQHFRPGDVALVLAAAATDSSVQLRDVLLQPLHVQLSQFPLLSEGEMEYAEAPTEPANIPDEGCRSRPHECLFESLLKRLTAQVSLHDFHGIAAR